MDLCRVEVETHETNSETIRELEATLSRKIRDSLGVEMEVRLVPSGSIKGSQGKQKVVEDRRNL